MNTKDITQFVKKAKVLSDKSRVALLLEIYQRGELSCEEAQHITGLSQPTVSHHLKLLAESELIITQKEHRHLRLIPNKTAINQFLTIFDEMKQPKMV